MVLDVSLLRTNPDIVKKSQRDRYKSEIIVDDVLLFDQQWKQEQFRGDYLNKTKNSCSKQISKKMKAKEAIGDSEIIPEEILKSLINLGNDDISNFTISQIKAISRTLDDEIIKSQEKVAELDRNRMKLLNEIGNILHKDVIISNDEENNGLIRLFGDTTVKKQFSHVDLVQMLNGANFKMGQRVAGSRCYYMTGALMWMEKAIVNYGCHFMCDKDYEGISPTLFMNKDAMQNIAQLSQFDNELYKVLCKRNEDQSVDAGEEEKYFIATSEQPIAALNADRRIPKSELPIRYLGVSECLRQEVGSHGRDTRGLFRVHQFKKLEQFCITSPDGDESENMFNSMIGNAEEFYKNLGLPYRVVSIVSGELNNAAAIKYDLEGWFPGSGSFRELVSCSNCTDYQARSVNTKFGETKQMNQEAEYVHMLNCTLSATTRTICCILENYQTEDGVIVPEVLRSHMPKKYREFIPFTKLPKK